MPYVIQGGNTASVAPGTYSGCEFLGIEPFTSKSGDELLRWKFRTPDGNLATAVSGASSPTVKNKLGKFLCALAHAPVKEGTSVEPTEFIGKKYFVVVTQNDKGSQVEMFSLIS